MPLTRNRKGGSGGETIPTKRHITATVVTLGHTALDEPGVLEHIEVMGEEIASHLSSRSQFGHGHVTETQPIDDVKTTSVTECGVCCGSLVEVHCSNYIDSVLLEQV
jgi:hypothetical protein